MGAIDQEGSHDRTTLRPQGRQKRREATSGPRAGGGTRGGPILAPSVDLRMPYFTVFSVGFHRRVRRFLPETSRNTAIAATPLGIVSDAMQLEITSLWAPLSTAV